jgi:hypothetical protein
MLGLNTLSILSEINVDFILKDSQKVVSREFIDKVYVTLFTINKDYKFLRD